MMEEASSIEIDQRDEQDWIYMAGGSKVMKSDSEWRPIWIVDVREQIQYTAFAPSKEITLAIKENFVRISSENGNIIGGFIVQRPTNNTGNS